MINERPLIVQSFNSDKYETKKFKKKNIVPFLYFSKKQFEKYREDNNCMIMGDVKVSQRKYKNIVTSDNPDKLIKRKSKKNIIGTVKMLRTSSVINRNGRFIETHQSFDLFESREYRHCIGYAYIGNNRFVRLVKPNLLFLLLFLLLIGVLAGLLSSCPAELPDETIKWAVPQEIEEITKQPIEQPPNCEFVLFEETTELNSENQAIRLINLPSNTGLYDIDYSVSINGEPLLDKDGTVYTSGRITPGNMVLLNLYDTLPAGEYLLSCKATIYYQNGGEELPQKHNLSTILIVNK